MQDLLDLLTKENKESYTVGDFNTDLLKFSNHGKTNDYLEKTSHRYTFL